MVVSMVAMGSVGLASPAADALDDDSEIAEPVAIDPALEERAEDGEELSVFVRLTELRDADPQVTRSSPEAFESALQDHASTTQATATEELSSFDGVEVVNDFWVTNALVVSVDTSQTDLDSLGDVSHVEQIHANFDVEHPGPQPAQDTEQNDVTYGLDQINAPDVWEEFDNTGQGASVAVLDSGIDPDHEAYDFNEENWGVWDDDGEPVDEEPFDENGHGTHVSGTVFGNELPDGTDFGVAPDTELYHGGVITPFGSSAGSVVAGIEWGVENDVDVVTMSLGFGDSLPFMIDPVENANDAGTVVVGSAGNEGPGESTTPGDLWTTVNVGATDEAEQIASFSSSQVQDTRLDWLDDDGTPAAGASDWPLQYVTPSVSAPGVDVMSTYPDNEYEPLSGTSMAAPHVAGTIALLRTQNADLSVSQIHGVLEGTAEVPEDGDPLRFGEGIIDAHAAVELVDGDTYIEGTVTDETGEPVTNAAVETDAGANDYTAADGAYSIAVESGDRTVSFDGFGYEPTDTTVTADDGATASESVELTREVAVDGIQSQLHPSAMAAGDNFTFNLHVNHLETYSWELTGDSTIDGDNIEIAVGGTDLESAPVGPDDEVTFDDPVKDTLTVEVSVDEAAANGSAFELDHTFAGVGDSVELTSGPSTTVLEDPDPGFGEIVDWEPQINLERGGTISASATVENTGEVTIDETVDWIWRGASIVQSNDIERFDPGQSESFDFSIGLGGEGFEMASQGVVTDSGDQAVSAVRIWPAGEAPSDYRVGDVTGSGDVTIDDAVAIQRDSLGLDPGTPFIPENADVNRDGNVTIDDAVSAQRASLGLLDEQDLQVTSIDAPEAATVSDEIEVTATVENQGGIGAFDPADFRIAELGEELGLETTADADTVDLAPGESVNLTYELEIDQSFEAGDYEHGVFTADDNATAEIEILDQWDFDEPMDQAVGETTDGEPGFLVENVTAPEDAALVATYFDDSFNDVVAGIETGDFDDMDVPMELADTGGVGDLHFFRLLPADELSDETQPGDVLSEDTDEATRRQLGGQVFDPELDFEDQQQFGAADELVVDEATLIPDGFDFTVDLHPTDEAGVVIPDEAVGQTETLRGENENVPLTLDDPIDETDDYVAMIHVGDSDEPLSTPPLERLAGTELEPVVASGTVTIEPAPAITGHVTNQVGDGVEDVTVTAEPTEVLESDDEVLTTTTDENGAYGFSGLDAGSYYVEAESPFDDEIDDQTVTLDADDVATVDFSFDDPAVEEGTVSGMVTDEVTDDPIADAEILDRSTGEVLATTDANGSYDASLAPGEYTLRADDDAYVRSGLKTIEVAANGTHTVDFALAPDLDGDFEDQAMGEQDDSNALYIDVSAPEDYWVLLTYPTENGGDQVDVAGAVQLDEDTDGVVGVELADGTPVPNSYHGHIASNVSDETLDQLVLSNETADDVLLGVDDDAQAFRSEVQSTTLEFEDQEFEEEATNVTVANATVLGPLQDVSPTEFTVEIHETEDDGSVGDIIGGSGVLEGDNENVTIDLDEPIEGTEDLVAMLHFADNDETGAPITAWAQEQVAPVTDSAELSPDVDDPASVAFVDNNPDEHGVTDAATMLDDELDAFFEVDVVDSTEADLIGDQDQYDVFVMNHFGDVDVGDFLDGLDADQGAVYMDAWDEEDTNAIREVAEERGDPSGAEDDFGSGSTYYEITQDSPLFDDVGTVGDEVDVQTDDGDRVFFDDYEGDIVGEVGQDGFLTDGPGVGVDDDRNEVILGGHGLSDRSTADGYTDEGETILVNAVEHVGQDALDATSVQPALDASSPAIALAG